MTHNTEHAALLDLPAAPAVALDPLARAAASLRGKDLVSMQDLSPAQAAAILKLAHELKAAPERYRTALASKQMAMFFEKPSLRTRITFEAGMNTLGGSAIFIDQSQSRLGARESLRDVALNLERWVQIVVLRTFAHATITTIAEYSSIPVINALSDLEHPCQALADFMTLEERFGSLRRVKLAYVGDGNNVSHSLMLAAALYGTRITVATPPQYGPLPEYVTAARTIAESTGAVIELTNDPLAAVAGADAVYTDVWASMGQESEAAERERIFSPYQVNDALMSNAAPEAIFLHCLPAHRGAEVAASVLDGGQSAVYDQAENRLHVQKALVLLLLGTTPGLQTAAPLTTPD
ncbi:MAG TPA: ornithine carbamoyltransferase [Acidisarcina sp.]